MGNLIILIILVGVIIFAVKSSARHFRGEGGCCGGGGRGTIKKEIPQKKLEGEKLGERIVVISGMHCDNCVYSVTKAINRLEGASAKVSLKKNRAVVSYDREIEDDAIRKGVEKEGFQVVRIEHG